jgi:Major Facilitator Superfamily
VPYLAAAGVVAGAGTALASLDSGAAPVAAAGAAAGAIVLAVSLRRLTPPRNLAARPGLTATILSRALLTCCFFAGDVYVPYAIVTVRHAPTALAAITLTASTLTWTAGAWVQARCIARYGPRRLVLLGECLIAAGLAVMCAVVLTPAPPALAIAAWALAGGGIGTAYAPLSVTTLDRAAAGEEGRAASALQLCDVLGQALGTGVAGAIVAAATAGTGHRHGTALAFAFAIAVAFAAIIAGTRLPDRLSSSRPAREAAGALPVRVSGHRPRQPRRRPGAGQQRRDRVHALERVLAEPHRGPVHRAALLRPRRHRPHQPQRTGEHDPPVHHPAQRPRLRRQAAPHHQPGTRSLMRH